MTRALLVFLTLLFICYLSAQIEPLGTLHCSEDKHPIWINVFGHLEGKVTEKRLAVWVCLEDYQEMNER